METIPRTVPAAFFRQWLQAPTRIGAIAPSSRRLALAMNSDVSSKTGPIIELGPGTGVFTQVLLERGVPPKNIAVIELTTRFASDLRAAWPSIYVIEGDAAHVAQLSPFARGSVQQVLCGLPLLSMHEDAVSSILKGSFELLKPDGVFRLFTYGAKCPVSHQLLRANNLIAKRVKTVILNVPPASVYEISKKE